MSDGARRCTAPSPSPSVRVRDLWWVLGGLALVVSAEGAVVPGICEHPTVVLTVSCRPNGRIWQGIGLNVTFPLVEMIDGSRNRSYPWVDVGRMNHEVTFLEQQIPTLLSVFSRQAGTKGVTFEYFCSFSPFGCEFVSSIQTADREIVVLNRTGRIVHGTGLDALKHGAATIEKRWGELCRRLFDFDTWENVSTILAQISSPPRILCSLETRTPLVYTLSLYGRGLKTVSANATRSEDARVVAASVLNASVPGYTLADLNCTVSSPFGWTRAIDERRVLAEELTETGVRVLVPVIVTLIVVLSCLLLTTFRQRLGLRRLDAILEEVRTNVQYRLTGKTDL